AAASPRRGALGESGCHTAICLSRCCGGRTARWFSSAVLRNPSRDQPRKRGQKSAAVSAGRERWERQMAETADLAKRIRQHTLRMIRKARSSHIGSAFSIAEVLAVLYADVLRVDPARPEWPDRDRLILSKGHACAAL